MPYGIKPRQLANSSDVRSEPATSGYPGLRRVHCECYEGIVVLSGTVPSYFLKQVAQTLVGALEGVMHIENRLEVRNQSQ